MQGVKLIFLWVFTVTACNAQITLRGEYNRPGLVDESQRFEFNDTTFKIYSYDHRNNSLSGGEYSIQGDTLILDYHPVTDPDAPRWEFTERDTLGTRSRGQIKEAAKVQLTVTNMKGGQPSAAFTLMGKNQRPITGYVLDEPLPDFFLSGDFIENLRFHNAAGISLSIPVDTLMGFNSKIHVYISNTRTSYNDFDGVKKFIILEKTEKQIRLEDLETGNDFSLIRQD